MIAKSSVFALAKALEGIPVLGSLSGTPAARAGIRYGDILISVNGVRTRTIQDYVDAKALRAEGMDVVVFRSGTESMQHLVYEEPAHNLDPHAILAELVTLRIAPGAFDGENDDDGDKPLG